MRWLPRMLRKASKSDGSGSTPTEDMVVAKLTARADLILEELDVVVNQMSAMLRDKAAGDD